MFGFAVTACTTAKYFPSLLAMIAATGVAICVIVFMTHESKRQTSKALRAAYLAGGIVLAPVIWIIAAAFTMPTGCFF